MTADFPALSVVIPALNEQASIANVVRAVLAQAQTLGVRAEALVVDGGSSDATRREAESGGARVVAQQAPGYGNALREGFAQARGEYVAVMDGDGSHDPAALAEMWRLRNNADLVVGSRLIGGGGMEVPWSRRWVSAAMNFFSMRGLGFPVADSSSGYRLYRASMLARVRTEARGFDVQQDLLMRMLAEGARTIEVPIQYVWRKQGVSKARVGLSALGYFRLAARMLGARLFGGRRGSGN